MAKTRDKRIKLVNEIRKRKQTDNNILGQIKYGLDWETRAYIYEKLPTSYRNLFFNNPFPTEYTDICKSAGVITDPPSIFQELRWYLELILQFSKPINRYLEINNRLEIAVLRRDLDSAWNCLDQLDSSVSVSYYSLLTEFYLNELSGHTEANKNTVNELITSEKVNLKLTILAEISRVRVDQGISAWQYDSLVEQHIQLYKKEEVAYTDYLHFKLNPLNQFTETSTIPFSLYLDADFSIIDRYQTIKRILPAVLLSNLISDLENYEVFNLIDQIAKEINDPYWKNWGIFSYNPKTVSFDPSNVFDKVQDLYFEGAYDKVVEFCLAAFQTSPNLSELYIYFVHAVIITGVDIESLFKEKNDLFDLLRLLKDLLQKKSTYNSDRETLLKRLQAISHFNFSYSVLEFIYNEYQLSVPPYIQSLAHLNSIGLKYNFYKLLSNSKSQAIVIKNNQSLTFKFIRQLISGESVAAPSDDFLPQKLLIGYLISKDRHQEALDQLMFIENNTSPEFVQTWMLRTFLKCFIHLKIYGQAATYITDYYFQKGFAYDHFTNSELFEELTEMTDEFSDNIAVPILFQIYNQPTSYLYDGIANLLIANSVEKPSDLIPFAEKWNRDRFLFFIEKCCTKDNMEDSPYLKTIVALEAERIELLNYLKLEVPENNDKYNAEILKITREASIRKGLLQIHESRIYVDDKNIAKNLETDFPELFDRYLELTDINQLDILSVKFNDGFNRTEITTTYYLKEAPQSDAEVIANNTTAVVVPQLRFLYFINLFDTLNNQFVFNEDYGFKSFLSMRIRHGTFSNALRSVFEKFSLISSKSLKTDAYQFIKFWETRLNIDAVKNTEVQQEFAMFSRAVDAEIDKGLSWLAVNTETGLFDFIFSDEQHQTLFINELGRISDYDQFVAEVFRILFERLEANLVVIREKVIAELSPALVGLLENLQTELYKLKLDPVDINLLDNHIFDCRTEIQKVTSQMVNWFKISKNQYIEEFPLDLILQTSIDYVNSINQWALSKGKVEINNNCPLRFKGEYFETFGDIFINIFGNVVGNNKDLEEQLSISIDINCADQELKIIVKNNLSSPINYDELDQKIEGTKEKIALYKLNPTSVAFEKGSGYLKLCKSIGADLTRDTYDIIPSRNENIYEVQIDFNVLGLIK